MGALKSWGFKTKSVNEADFMIHNVLNLPDCVQVITMTADNASNNATMMEKLETLFDNDIIDFDATKSTIRCLAHVIHLAVMDLLVEVKAVKKKDVREDEVDLPDDWSEDIAEGLGDDGELGDLGGLTDEDLLERQSKGEDEVDLSSVIQKVCGFVYLLT